MREFAEALQRVAPGDEDPEATVSRFASAYFDEQHFSGPTAIPLLREAVEKAEAELTIRSAQFADRSTGGAPDEPTAQESVVMLPELDGLVP